MEKKTMERSCAAAAAVSNKKLTYANVVAGKKPLPILDGPDSEEEFTSKPHEWVKVERKRPKEAKKGHLKLYLKKRSFKTQLSTPRMTTKKTKVTKTPPEEPTPSPPSPSRTTTTPGNDEERKVGRISPPLPPPVTQSTTTTMGERTYSDFIDILNDWVLKRAGVGKMYLPKYYEGKERKEFLEVMMPYLNPTLFFLPSSSDAGCQENVVQETPPSPPHQSVIVVTDQPHTVRDSPHLRDLLQRSSNIDLDHEEEKIPPSQIYRPDGKDLNEVFFVPEFHQCVAGDQEALEQEHLTTEMPQPSDEDVVLVPDSPDLVKQMPVREDSKEKIPPLNRELEGVPCTPEDLALLDFSDLLYYEENRKCHSKRDKLPNGLPMTENSSDGDVLKYLSGSFPDNESNVTGNQSESPLCTPIVNVDSDSPLRGQIVHNLFDEITNGKVQLEGLQSSQLGQDVQLQQFLESNILTKAEERSSLTTNKLQEVNEPHTSQVASTSSAYIRSDPTKRKLDLDGGNSKKRQRRQDRDPVLRSLLKSPNERRPPNAIGVLPGGNVGNGVPHKDNPNIRAILSGTHSVVHPFHDTKMATSFLGLRQKTTKKT
ncbi:uncharacterized protein LOC135498718 [Lineus longissimus]|uniref:uncharacterized protein LOC135498718 n=1 Tax=Lineus longissimus TaxID=88925 RepID=UPI00315CAE98